jgi:hypothetical protein
MSDNFRQDEATLENKALRHEIISGNLDPEKRYGDSFDEKAIGLHSTAEMVKMLKENDKCDIDARVLVATKDGHMTLKKMKKSEFLEQFSKKSQPISKFRESFDSFQFDDGGSGGLVGKDYIPLLGGPFNKQLYIYDYLKMHSAAFHAYHHDPIARHIVNMKRDFTLGRGWNVTSKNPLAQALWAAFEEANDLYNLMDSVALEIEIYGEVMFWELPNMETKIAYNLRPGQEVPRGLLPRIRLIDPSVIWEIITYPEDITRVLAYQWVAPTQYQIYSRDEKSGQSVSSSKFIFQQIPASQVDHWKINCVSNEKRGRSGLFPILGYMKRLRDSVNYSIVGMQKASAWSIDTEIDGSVNDINNYMDQQKAIGTIAPAGSEFVHSTKVKRNYLSNQGASKGGQSQAFDWCLSMIAAGTGFPISYLNTHLSGGQTKASALVATEPVTKMLEKRQLLYERMMKKLAKRLFERFGLKDAEIEVTFPELVVQDRSAKLTDLALAEAQQWIDKKTAAIIAAQELQITEYNYDKTKEAVEEEGPIPKMQPLTKPPAVPPAPSKSSISSNGKKDVEASNAL